MQRRIKAIVFPRPNEVALQTFAMPDCGPDEVVCESIYSFVSPGTELRILAGSRESAGKFPLIPGYSWVGRVIEVGSNLRGWSEGDLVSGRNPIPVPGAGFMWGGQASHHRCEVTGYDSVLKLPPGADPWNYVPTEVAAISWRGASIAFARSGETAVVIGQGLVGAFAARWLMLMGARVIAVDTVASRLERAGRWGAAAVVDALGPDTREQILAQAPGGADIVIEASGSRGGVELANAVLRQPEARRTHSDYPVARLHADAHYWPRLVYLATYSHTHQIEPGEFSGGEGAVVLKPSDRTVGDRLAVMEQIRLGLLPLGDIVAAPTPVAQAPEAYFELRDNPHSRSTIVFDWRA